MNYIQPETIKLTGGPYDGSTIAWPGGFFAVLRVERNLVRYDYDVHRDGDTITILTAHYVGPHILDNEPAV